MTEVTSERVRQAYAALRDEPAITVDGAKVSLNINAGLEIDVAHLDDTGADGIGLYRTEIPFMVRAEYPDVEAQTELYARAPGGVPMSTLGPPLSRWVEFAENSPRW